MPTINYASVVFKDLNLSNRLLIHGVLLYNTCSHPPLKYISFIILLI